MTTSGGTVCYDADFDPFGGEHAYTNNCPSSNVYKFEGKERDTETGNDDFGARYYTSRFGRWLSADWSSTPVPVPYANLTNPQTLNLYAMVADDPESFADLDGHQSLESQRQAAVRQAWKQEQQLVATKGEGTVDWTPAQKAELLQTGKVSGYEGHHINSAKEKAFEGIDELRPADVRPTDPQGNFLRELVEQERLAGKPALLKLNILPIGGIYRGSKKHVFRLVTKMLGTTDHDLVVEKKSSVPQFFPAGESVTCSHFEYFSPSQESSDQFRRAVAAVRQALGFEQAQIERMLALSSDLDVNKPITFKDKAKGSTGS